MGRDRFGDRLWSLSFASHVFERTSFPHDHKALTVEGHIGGCDLSSIVVRP